MPNKKIIIGLIYEISGNPYFGAQQDKSKDRICEFPKPSEVNQLAQVLKELEYGVEIIDGPRDLLRRASELRSKCSLLFNKSIGYHGLERKIAVPAICQLSDMPFLGTSAYGMTLARHKYHTNRLLSGIGFNVPNAILMQVGSTPEPNDLRHLHFPVIVKPNHESDALGITDDSVCYDFGQTNVRIKMIHDRFDQPAIIEEFIGGEEWKVAVLGNCPNTHALGCVGVMKNGIPITGSLQTRTDVVEDTLSYYTPTNDRLVQHALHLATQIHNIMGLCDYSRCDFRLDKQDKLCCMEVSTHPDIDAESSFITAAKQSLLDYDTIIRSIVETALSRYTKGNIAS